MATKALQWQKGDCIIRVNESRHHNWAAFGLVIYKESRIGLAVTLSIPVSLDVKNQWLFYLGGLGLVHGDRCFVSVL